MFSIYKKKEKKIQRDKVACRAGSAKFQKIPRESLTNLLERQTATLCLMQVPLSMKVRMYETWAPYVHGLSPYKPSANIGVLVVAAALQPAGKFLSVQTRFSSFLGLSSQVKSEL